MGMLKSITLENYKSFRDNTTIDIKPLTILCGVNSSGKSSILKSLLMMKQTVEKESPYNKLAFIGNYVDNGYFEDVINFEIKNDEKATFTLENTFELDTFNPDCNRYDIQSYKEICKLYYFVNEARKFELTHKITVMKTSKSNNDFLQYIENNDVIFNQITIKVKDENNYEIPKCTGTIKLKKCLNSKSKYLLEYYNIPCEGKLVKGHTYCHCYFNNIKLINFYKQAINSNIVAAKPTILSMHNIISMQYTGIDFIAPLRQHPERNYIIKGDVNSVGISGENAPILLAKLQNSKRFTDIPFPLENDNGFNIDFKPNYKEFTFTDHIQEWLDYFELGKLSLDGNYGLLELKINDHNIADIGFGVSQVLPIIVQGLYMQKDSVLLLEQPEIHLHPKMQMSMADFLISVASTERNIILETHSDHIINRIVRRVMENYGTQNDISQLVQIYFISKDEKNNTIINKDICIDPYKGLINCPKEFFDQYGDELRVIMKQGLNNIKSKMIEV